MERLAKARKYIPHVILLLMIAAAVFVLSRPRILRGDPEGTIPFEMPEELGHYTGELMYFCQNDQCGRAWRESELTELAASASDAAAAESLWRKCSYCTNDLSQISIGERILLPPETPIFRRFYTCPGQLPVQATVVFSGSERRSIHRPQICLVAQGNQLINEYNYDMNVGDGRRMPVRVIEMVNDQKNRDGTKLRGNAVYAYWYFNPHVETPSHFGRMLRVVFDNAFRSYRPRWAYVSMAIALPPDKSADFRDTLDDFGPAVYAELEKLRKTYREREAAAE